MRACMQICAVAVREVTARPVLAVVLFDIHWSRVFCSCSVGCERERGIRKALSGSPTQYLCSAGRGRTQTLLLVDLCEAFISIDGGLG